MLVGQNRFCFIRFFRQIHRLAQHLETADALCSIILANAFKLWYIIII